MLKNCVVMDVLRDNISQSIYRLIIIMVFFIPDAKILRAQYSNEFSVITIQNPAFSSFIAGLNRELKFVSSVHLSMDYQYGLMPAHNNSAISHGIFSSEGSISVALFQIPFELNCRFSKPTIYHANYLHLSFDASSYKNRVDEELRKLLETLSQRTDSLKRRQQEALQEIYYCQVILRKLRERSNLIDQSYSRRIDTFFTIKSIQTALARSGMVNALSDMSDTLRTIKKISIVEDSLLTTNSLVDAISEANELIEDNILKYKNCIDDIRRNQLSIESLAGSISKTASKISALPKFGNVLYYMKKAQIGLCYPSSSAFLLNEAHLNQGIDFEWGNEKYFLTGSGGYASNNFSTSPPMILSSGTSPANFFDPPGANWKKLYSAKGGIGKKEGSHLYMGFLSGSRSQYSIKSDTSFFSCHSSSVNEANLVIEVDTRWQINNHHHLEFVYGRSSNQGNETAYQKNLTHRFLDHSIRSNALFGKYIGEFPKSATEIDIQVKYVDPFFNSFGAQYLIPNSLQYELNVNQNVVSSWDISIHAHRQRTNVLSLTEYSIDMINAGGSVIGAIGKNLLITGNYEQIFHSSTMEKEITSSATDFTSSLNITSNHHFAQQRLIINAGCGIDRLNSVSQQPELFGNGSFSCALEGKIFTHSLSAILLTPLPDLLEFDRIYCEIESNCDRRKLSLSAALRYSFNKYVQWAWGGSLSASWLLSDLFRIGLEVSRLSNDFYHDFYSGNRFQFPYVLSTRLTLDIN